MLVPLDACVTLFFISLSSILYMKTRRKFVQPSRSQAYILQNQVTHARLLPTKSAHSFTYPTLSLLLSLNALEDHALDLGKGFVFGYGGLWGRLTGVRSSPYLTGQGSWSIRNKLEHILTNRGFMDDGVVLDDAWMMTMPSLLGYEGINPLTVYFCYKPGDELWLTILEVILSSIRFRGYDNLIPLFFRFITRSEKVTSTSWKWAKMKTPILPKGLSLSYTRR